MEIIKGKKGEAEETPHWDEFANAIWGQIISLVSVTRMLKTEQPHKPTNERAAANQRGMRHVVRIAEWHFQRLRTGQLRVARVFCFNKIMHTVVQAIAGQSPRRGQVACAQRYLPSAVDPHGQLAVFGERGVCSGAQHTEHSSRLSGGGAIVGH